MHVGERNIFVTFFGNLANRSLSVKQSWGKIKCLLGDIVMYPDVMSNEISSLLNSSFGHTFLMIHNLI